MRCEIVDSLKILCVRTDGVTDVRSPELKMKIWLANLRG